jgi:hypothetical protein
LIAAGAENMKWLNTFMKIAELQSASKPLSPEQARVRAMKQGIDRQKLALARERERQQNAKHAQKMQKLQQKSLGL